MSMVDHATVCRFCCPSCLSSVQACAAGVLFCCNLAVLHACLIANYTAGRLQSDAWWLKPFLNIPPFVVIC